MSNRRKLSIRTEIFEQIVIRSKSTKLKFCANRREANTGLQAGGERPDGDLPDENGRQEKVLEGELSGSIETVENDSQDRST